MRHTSCEQAAGEVAREPALAKSCAYPTQPKLHTHTHAHTNTCTHTRTHAHTHMHMHTHLHTRTCTHSCTHTYFRGVHVALLWCMLSKGTDSRQVSGMAAYEVGALQSLGAPQTFVCRLRAAVAPQGQVFSRRHREASAATVGEALRGSSRGVVGPLETPRDPLFSAFDSCLGPKVCCVCAHALVPCDEHQVALHPSVGCALWRQHPICPKHAINGGSGCACL